MLMESTNATDDRPKILIFVTLVNDWNMSSYVETWVCGTLPCRFRLGGEVWRSDDMLA